MSTDKRYEKLIELLKEWLNEESDHELKYFEEEMRDRSKKIKTAIAPKMNITRKPEIDRILEEAEAHMPQSKMPKNWGKVGDGSVFPGKAQSVTVPKGESVQAYTARHQSSDFISSCNKERIVSLLWEAYEANLESLKTLIGEDTRIKIAKERVSSCIEDWRLENAVD